MEQLADEGWLQMKELLRKEELVEVKEEPAFVRRKIPFFIGVAACLLVLFFCFHPYQVHSPRAGLSASVQEVVTANQFNNKANNSSVEKEATGNKNHLPGNMANAKRIILISSNYRGGSYPHYTGTRNIIPGSSHIAFAEPAGNDQNYLGSVLMPLLTEKIPGEEGSLHKNIGMADATDSIKSPQAIDRKNKKDKNSFSKRVQFYAGVASNISAINNSLLSFDQDKFNLHPAITFIIPFNTKFSLHSGLYIMSTVHGKDVNTKEKDLVNNMSANLNYNVNTTSIIKASYFDLPVTLHYQFSKNWSVGSGMQLSKLYKVNVKEENESFDYNNQLIASTVSTYGRGPVSTFGAFEKKVKVKSIEPLLVLETDLKKNNWLFSAGYFYGTGKSIMLQQPNGTSRYYRNQYIKLGVQYRLGK